MIAALLFGATLQQGPQISEKVVRELLALPVGYRGIEYGARLLALGKEDLAIMAFVDLLHELREQPAMTTAVIETIRFSLEVIDEEHRPSIEEELFAKLPGRDDDFFTTLPVETQERVLQAVLDARRTR